MGADYPEQDKAISELKALSDNAKVFLSHHIRNSLAGVIGGIDTGKLDIAKVSAEHIVEDLEKIGC
jgi:hypothetical protein